MTLRDLAEGKVQMLEVESFHALSCTGEPDQLPPLDKLVLPARVKVVVASFMQPTAE